MPRHAGIASLEPPNPYLDQLPLVGIRYDRLEPLDPYLDHDASWTRLPSRTSPNSPFEQSNRAVFRPNRHGGQFMPDADPPTRRSSWFPPLTPDPVHHPYPRPRPRRHEREQALLPPSSVSLAIQVVQDMAKATVTHTFQNDTQTAINNGAYQFPLPHGSSVIDFACRVGDNRIIRGQVKPRQAARDGFDNAVQRGRTAGLVEQNSAEIFSTRIGNIPALAHLKAELSFIFFLKHNFVRGATTMTLTIPTYIAPRYGSPGFELDETGPQRDRNLEIAVEILAADEITDIRSDTHRVAIERGIGQRPCQRWADFVAAGPPPSNQPRAAKVTLADGPAFLDRDFTLVISMRSPAQSEQPEACLESHPSLGGHSALMITIPPRFMLQYLTPVADGELIFLADRSGSMLDKISGLRSSMEVFLRGMPVSRRFNVWCFGSTHDSLWETPRANTQASLDEALGYVTRFASDMGGTDILPAIQAVLGTWARHGPLDVIILTDGEVWQPEKTIEYVRKMRMDSQGAARFFSIGIGNAVSHELVEGIAKAGGGYAEIIPAASDGGWEDRVVAVQDAALTGHVGPLGIELEGVDFQREGGKPLFRHPACGRALGKS